MDMKGRDGEWLTLAEGARHFGYQHVDSLRNRIRQLRKRGKVVDLGSPPSEYQRRTRQGIGKVVLFWVNPNTALLRSDASPVILDPRRGRRATRDN